MADYLEAKYIQVVWQDKDTALKIVESDQAIEIEELASDNYELEVINYSKLDSDQYGQLAIRLLNNQHDLIPYFQVKGGGRQELLPVKDNSSGKIWWVERHWHKEGRRWSSKIFRSAGFVKLLVGPATYNIHISSSTFTSDQLAHYLNDFRHDLWELILDDSSYIQGAGKLSDHVKVDKASIKTIAQFIEYAEAVLKTPKVELREVQRLELRKKVRPVPRTFMELTTRGDGKYLTSRASVDSLDVPENQYIHYALKRVYILLRALTGVSNMYAKRLDRNINSYRERLVSFSGVVEINEEAVRYDLQEKTDNFSLMSRCVQDAARKIYSDVAVGSRTDQYIPWALVFLVDKEAEYLGQNTFFAKVKYPDNDSWFEPGDNGYVTIEFHEKFPVEKNSEYKITGFIIYESEFKNDKMRYIYRINKIDSIEIVGGYKFDSYIKKISEIHQKILLFENSGWLRPLSKDEVGQQEREISSIKRVLSMLEVQKENMTFLAESLQPKIPVIKRLIEDFQKASVRVSSYFPSSMTFVQNPNYQGVYASFKKIRDLSGIDDDDLLLALERIENIGIVNISTLYERWCLVQIIKVLMQKYHYRPEDKWKKKLTSQVLDSGKNISLTFKNEAVDRVVTLWYEKELASGRRPDFILDIDAGHWDGSHRMKHRFVLDAKFYENINSSRHGGISSVIEELYFEADYSKNNTTRNYRERFKNKKGFNNKNYSEDYDNSVFIIHPSLGSIQQRKTPQKWGASNFYGEVQMFDWDKDLRNKQNHKYGSIALSPVVQGDYADDLQRLIGMFLQYGVGNNSLDNSDLATVPGAKVFCIACGFDSCEWSQGKNKKVWWATCGNCRNFSVYSYCANDKCRNRLIKNGDYWTYHSTEPLNPLNVKCPSCAGLL